jgi:hypothetical protein
MKRQGVEVIEGMPIATEWVPYKLWRADLWKCPCCQIEIVTGFGLAPELERHHAEFDETIARRATAIRVNDC